MHLTFSSQFPHTLRKRILKCEGSGWVTLHSRELSCPHFCGLLNSVLWFISCPLFCRRHIAVKRGWVNFHNTLELERTFGIIPNSRSPTTPFLMGGPELHFAHFRWWTNLALWPTQFSKGLEGYFPSFLSLSFPSVVSENPTYVYFRLLVLQS